MSGNYYDEVLREARAGHQTVKIAWQVIAILSALLVAISTAFHVA